MDENPRFPSRFPYRFYPRDCKRCKISTDSISVRVRKRFCQYWDPLTELRHRNLSEIENRGTKTEIYLEVWYIWRKPFFMVSDDHGGRCPDRRRFRRRRISRGRARLHSFVLWIAIHRAKAATSRRVIPSFFLYVHSLPLQRILSTVPLSSCAYD